MFRKFEEDAWFENVISKKKKKRAKQNKIMHGWDALLHYVEPRLRNLSFLK